MRLCYLILLVGILFDSCSTLVHQSTMNVNIHSNMDSTKVCVDNDTIHWHTIPATIITKRSKEDLVLTIKNDTIQQQLNVKSRLSTAFWLGNMFSGVGVIGYAIDLTNAKRYSYPTTVFVHFDDDNPRLTAKYSTWLNPTKNLLNFKISIPEGNWFYLNTGNGYGNSFGFLGISGGFEYYFTNKYCLNIDFGGLTDFMLPFPAPVDYEGAYDRAFAIYGDIQIGSDYKRLHYDVGLQFNRTLYYERETVELYPEYVDTLKYSVKQTNLGLAFSTYYRITKGFNIGLNYYPSFITMQNGNTKFEYSHLLFLELSFRIEAYRPRKK